MFFLLSLLSWSLESDRSNSVIDVVELLKAKEVSVAKTVLDDYKDGPRSRNRGEGRTGRLCSSVRG